MKNASLSMECEYRVVHFKSKYKLFYFIIFQNVAGIRGKSFEIIYFEDKVRFSSHVMSCKLF